MHGRILPMTPAGLQSLAELERRRLLVAAMSGVIYLTLLLWLAAILSAGGWTLLRGAILIAFAIAAPWSVLGASNAALGFWLLHVHRDGLAAVAPFAVAAASDAPLQSRTALLLTLRNEDPSRAFQRLRAMRESLEATGSGDHFAFFVLSDTSDSRIASEEEAELDSWRGEDPALADRLHYRRRASNEGYKAGNIRDFVERCGGAFDFMIPLDADSLMDGETILKLVRIGEAHAAIGTCKRSSSARRRIRPSRASSSSACVKACAPIRWEPPGGPAIADLFGGIMRSSASRPSQSIVCCRSSKATVTSFRMIRSRLR